MRQKKKTNLEFEKVKYCKGHIGQNFSLRDKEAEVKKNHRPCVMQLQ